MSRKIEKMRSGADKEKNRVEIISKGRGHGDRESGKIKRERESARKMKRRTKAGTGCVFIKYQSVRHVKRQRWLERLKLAGEWYQVSVHERYVLQASLGRFLL